MENLIGINHEDVFKKNADLPSFNSHAIETVLHHVDSLSDRFLYFNDDFFLCQPVEPEDFFWGDDGVYFFPSPHDIPYQRPAKAWKPVDQGAINAAKLLQRDFSCQPAKKLHHAPYPLSKSILAEMEQRYRSEVETTRSHPFRHPNDIAMATTLHAYYAQCTGHGKPKDIKTRYVDIGDWRFLGLVHPWSPLMRGKYTTLCLNEVQDIHNFKRLRDHFVKRVMQRLFD